MKADFLSADEQDLIVVHAVVEWLGLTEPWLYDAVRFLPDEVTTHIVCRKTSNLEYFQVPNLHSVSEQRPLNLLFDRLMRRFGLRKSWKLLINESRKHGVQVLHSHFGPVGWQNIQAAKTLSIPHLVSFYGQDVDRLPRIDGRWVQRYENLFETADRVLCLGPHMKSRLQSCGCPESKLVVHSLGICLEELPFVARTWRRDEPLRILIAASFREKKGIPYAIGALGLLHREVPLEVTIIGGAANEQRSIEEGQRILSSIEKNGLTERVKLMGYQPRKVLQGEAYRNHIFLAPSITASDGDTEGTPVTIMEMAATGIIVVSTNHSDIPHIVRDGKTGFLAKERDIGGLAGCLREAVNRRDDWLEIANEARRRIEEQFDAKNQGRRLADLYRTAVI